MRTVTLLSVLGLLCGCGVNPSKQVVLETASAIAGGPQVLTAVHKFGLAGTRKTDAGTTPFEVSLNLRTATSAPLDVEGVRYTMFVNAATKLPAAIYSIGEPTIATLFDGYAEVGGYRLPTHIVTKVAGKVFEELTLDQQWATGANGWTVAPPMFYQKVKIF
jgi:hypothetical protein